MVQESIKLYNTLTKKKEVFKPIIKGEVKIYSCGPTVYSTPHIGNLRAAVFIDILKRILRYFDYKVIDVVNITDVGHLVSDEDDGEDKMLKAAKKENKNPFEIAKHYEKIYLDSIKKLNVILPKFMPRATEHIKEQIDVIKALEKGDYTYITSDGVYFDVSKFENYGKLSGKKISEEDLKARIKKNSEKKNPQDFALWKFLIGDNKNHIMKWDSPWGVGFPGWHIECSAMSNKYLGTEFDIHTGGIDHIPVHHENEIAQNEASGFVKKINYWIHNAHLNVEGEKISKSLGNGYSLEDLEKKGYTSLGLREAFLRSSYRQQMNFTFDSLNAGEQNVKKINEFYQDINNYKKFEVKSVLNDEYKASLKKFENSIKDDMNTPKALAAVFDFISFVRKLEKLSKEDLKLAKDFIEKTDIVLGLLKKEKVKLPKQVIEFAKKRKTARQNKDFEKADELRLKIEEFGYKIKDSKTSKEGYIIEKNE
jgi:cysteinyl-tRNA synthetase